MSFRFSLGRFSTPTTPEGEAYDIDLRVHLSEAINAAISIGAVAEITDLMFSESITGSANVESGIPFVFDVGEAIGCEAYEAHSILTNLYLEEIIGAQAEMGANIGIAGTWEETLDAAVELGATIGFGMDMLEELQVSADLGASIYSNCVFSEIISGTADVIALEEESALFTISLPPGSELRFDTENYNVLLDGVNILHLQEGEWFKIRRNLQYISVDSGVKGTLEGKVIYQERWL